MIVLAFLIALNVYHVHSVGCPADFQVRINHCKPPEVDQLMSEMKEMMPATTDIDAFIRSLQNYDASRVKPQNITVLKYLCDSGELDRMLTCMDGLLTLCKTDPQTKRVLDLALSPIEKQREAYHLLCNNVNLLRDQSMCMHERVKPEVKCVLDATIKFRDEKNYATDGEEIIEASCSYIHTIIDNCLYNTMAPCGEELQTLMKKFVEGVAKPPICYNSAATLVSSMTLFALLLSFFSKHVI